MKYQVFITEKAEEDLNSIADYLIYKLNAGENALKQIDRIEQTVTSLEEMPERYRVYDKEPWKNKNLRVAVVDNYLVFYITDNDDGNPHSIRKARHRRTIVSRKAGNLKIIFAFTNVSRFRSVSVHGKSGRIMDLEKNKSI